MEVTVLEMPPNMADESADAATRSACACVGSENNARPSNRNRARYELPSRERFINGRSLLAGDPSSVIVMIRASSSLFAAQVYLIESIIII